MQKFWWLLTIVIILSACYEDSPRNINVYDRTERNYGKSVEKYAQKYSLHAEYLKALIVLECDGASPAPARFEQGVFDKLKAVKDSSGAVFENITHDMLKSLSDSMLREMSHSYGAFQIMGYKCTWIGITLDELKTKSTLWGAYWIDKTYGKLVRDSLYKDAFHLHNAGKLYPDSGEPLTHSPDYVERGLKHLEIFRKRQAKQAAEGEAGVKVKIIPPKVIKSKEERYKSE